MSELSPDRRGYFSFPLLNEFHRGVLLDNMIFTDNTVLSEEVQTTTTKLYTRLPQNCIRDYHKTVYDHYHKTVYARNLKNPYRYKQKTAFSGLNMYTYMYCMYRIGGIIAAAYSNERRLYAQYVKNDELSLLWSHG